MRTPEEKERLRRQLQALVDDFEDAVASDCMATGDLGGYEQALAEDLLKQARTALWTKLEELI